MRMQRKGREMSDDFINREMLAERDAAVKMLDAALARITALEAAINAALERLDASLFTNAEHQQAKDILRGARK